MNKYHLAFLQEIIIRFFPQDFIMFSSLETFDTKTKYIKRGWRRMFGRLHGHSRIRGTLELAHSTTVSLLLLLGKQSPCRLTIEEQWGKKMKQGDEKVPCVFMNFSDTFIFKKEERADNQLLLCNFLLLFYYANKYIPSDKLDSVLEPMIKALKCGFPFPQRTRLHIYCSCYCSFEQNVSLYQKVIPKGSLLSTRTFYYKTHTHTHTPMQVLLCVRIYGARCFMCIVSTYCHTNL